MGEDFFRYRFSRIGKVTLHCISSPTYFPHLLSVSLSVGFGGVHCGFSDQGGLTRSFPQGMAHFMEHLLFWLNLDSLRSKASSQYAADPNAVVSADRTTWYFNNVMIGSRDTPLPEQRVLASTFDLIDLLLNFATGGSKDRTIVEGQIERTVRDIESEIGYRHSNFTGPRRGGERTFGDYGMDIALRALLFPGHGLGGDFLGTRESLRAITIDHVEAALRLARNAIESVVITGPHFSDQMFQELQEFIERRIGIQLPDIAVLPGAVGSRTERASFATIGLDGPDIKGFARVLFGMELPSLTSLYDGDELKRQVILNYAIGKQQLLTHGVAGMLSKDARMFYVATAMENPLFFVDDRSLGEMAAELKRMVIQTIASTKESLDSRLISFYLQMSDNRSLLMQFCNTLDLFSLDLRDLSRIIEQICDEDVERLIQELAACNNLGLVHKSEVAAIFSPT